MSRSAILGKRSKLDKKLRPVLSSKNQETENSQEEVIQPNSESSFTSQYLIEQFVVNLKIFKLTLDMFFRICDASMSKKITLKQFTGQIGRMDFKYSDSMIQDIFAVFDEDLKGEVTYSEFVDTCDAYKANLSVDFPKNYISISHRSLVKLVKKMTSKNIKPDYLFLINRSKKVSIKDFYSFVENTLKLNLKKREQYALAALCDTDNDGVITKDDFTEVYNKGQRLVDMLPSPMKNNYFDLTNEDSNIDLTNECEIEKNQEKSIGEYRENPNKEIISKITKFEDGEEKQLNVFIKTMRASIISIFPNLSTDAIDKLLKELKEDKISFSKFLNCLDSKEQTVKPDDSKSPKTKLYESKLSPKKIDTLNDTSSKVNKDKAVKVQAKEPEEAKVKVEESKDTIQQDWIAYFIDACKKNHVDPIQLVKIADVNKNNELEIDELERVTKLYIKSPSINSKDLQNILNCFDTNKDGVCTVQEYKDIILKCRSNNESKKNVSGNTDKQESKKKTLSEKDKKDFMNLLKSKCTENNISLKGTISECEFNEKYELSVESVARQIELASKMTQAESKKLFDIITSNPDAISVTAEQIFKFYDEYLAEDPDIRLELKLVLAKKESESSPSILNYLKVELSMDPEGDILLKEFIKTMSDCLEIQKSSSEFIYKQITSFNNRNVQPRLVDFYCLLLNERDHDKVANEQLDPNAVFAKLSAFIKNKYKNSKNALADLGAEYNFDFSAGGSDSELHVYEFEEIFVDLNEVMTAREALCLFDDIKAKYKVEGNAITGENFYDYFQNKIKPYVVKKLKLNKDINSSRSVSKESKISGGESSQRFSKSIKTFIQVGVERPTNIFLPECFNHIDKSIILKSSKVVRILEILYKKNGVNQSELKWLSSQIMDGRKELKIQEYFTNIKELTTYKCKEIAYNQKLEMLIAKQLRINLEFDTNSEKSYVNIILSQPSNKCVKFELLNVFYKSMNLFKKYAEDFIERKQRQLTNRNKNKPPKNLITDDSDSKLPIKKADTVNRNDDIFDNIGKPDDEKYKSNENIKTDLIMNKIFENIKDKNDLTKPDVYKNITFNLVDNSRYEDEKEIKEFNRIMDFFIKNFQDIIKLENILKNIDASIEFLIRCNGSKSLLDYKNKYNSENADILDLWKETDKWEFLKFSSELEKYIWAFFKLDMHTNIYTVNLTKLENFYGKITKKNKMMKANKMIANLNSVYTDLVALVNDNSDLNKATNLNYNPKTKDGLKIQKGSAEELIQDIKQYVANADNKKKLYDTFATYQDSREEVSIDQIKKILDENGITNTKKQREYLFKIMDSDNDVMVSVKEFKNFINKYDAEVSIGTNILNKDGKKNKFE